MIKILKKMSKFYISILNKKGENYDNLKKCIKILLQ